MTSTRAAPLELHLSWLNNELHLWAINRATGHTAAPNELARHANIELGRNLATQTTPARAPLQLPGGQRAVATLRIDAGALTYLPSHIHSNTVRWFALVGDLARAALQAERLRPHLATVGHIRSATWVPVVDDAIEATLAALTEQMPPACGIEDLDAFFALVVDASARRRLSELAWRPNPPGHPHGTEFRAAQTTFRALAAGSSSVLYRTDDLESIDELAPLFADEVTRAHGLAVVGAQLRLHLPDDADDPWKLALELVDVDSPERWCTAADVAGAEPFSARRRGRTQALFTLTYQAL